MRKRAHLLVALIFCLLLPVAAQQPFDGSTVAHRPERKTRDFAQGKRRRAARPAGPLRFGSEVRAQTSAGPLVCRPLYLRGKTQPDDVFLDYIHGNVIPLLEGFVAYRGCRLNSGSNPPQLEGLGGWAVVNIAGRHVEYLRLHYFDDARSQPAWNGNLVAYWGVFVHTDARMGGKPGVLQAMVMDWQHRLIVARQGTQLGAPADGELPAPRWVKKGSVAYEQSAEARFEFAAQTVRLEISPRFLR